MKVKLSELNEIVLKATKSYGYSDEEAEVIKDILMYAQMRGNNQGVVKLIGKGVIPKSPDEAEPKILKETKLSQLIDGGKRFAMLVMNQATKTAISKAKEHGFGIVGITNTFTSTGAIGYYARKIADQDLVGFVFAGSPSTVNPHGSFEAKFGTNPLAVGIPGKKRHFVFDMATSAMAFFGLVEAKTAGREIPGDIAYDAEGNLTTDPGKAMDGAIRPFDRSYKGYGLSLMVELLTGPFITAGFTGVDTEQGWGNLVMAIDPEMFGSAEELKRKVDLAFEKVKSAKKLDDTEEIFIPGEKGDRLAEEREKAGEIEVEDNLYKGLREVAEK